jgi:hypothetical protein
MKRKNVAYLMALLAITLALMFSGSVNLEKDTSISTSKSTIIIQKFSDTNFNGIVDPDEERLPGWMFIITGPNGMTTTYVTNDRGEIRIEVPEGKYIIVERQLPPGWTSTTPATQVVNVQKGETTVIVFLNSLLAIPTSIPSPSPSLEESIDEEIKKLPKGRILFNPPKEMKVGEPELVEVRITKSMTEELTRDLKGRGAPTIEEINVSTSMKVRLTGINFDIKPQNGAAQVIESDKFTKWVFFVTPLKSGIQTLHVRVYVIISIPDYDDKEKEYEVEDWEINVKVNPVWFLTCNWQFIVGTLIAIVALIISIIGIRKKQREKR